MFLRKETIMTMNSVSKSRVKLMRIRRRGTRKGEGGRGKEDDVGVMEASEIYEYPWLKPVTI